MTKQILREFSSNTNNSVGSDDMYIIHKKKEVSLYLTPSEVLNTDLLVKKLCELCVVNGRYSILTRVCYIDCASFDSDDVTDWKTLEGQIYLHNNESEDFSILCNNYISSIKKRLSESMLHYEFRDQDLLGFQILIYKIDYTNNIIPKNINLNTLANNKDLINVYRTNLGFGSLPLVSSKDKFGKELDKVIDNNIVKSVILSDGNKINLIEKINFYAADKDKLSNFNLKTNFYQLSGTNNIVTVDNNDNGESVVDIYDTNGIKIQHLVDKPLGKNDFSRKVGNVEAFVNNKLGVYKKTIKLSFKYVYPNKLSGHFSKLIFTDPRIGTFDLETYLDPYGKSKVYALGFYVNNYTKTFYIDKFLDSDSLIMRCLDSMLIEKYNGYTFYVHNLGRFDIYFILKVIVNANTHFPNIYNYNLILREKTIICVSLSKRIGRRTYKIKIVDSFNFLSSSLSKLCKTFDCETQKSLFPYKFVKKDTIFYKGKKPNIKYFEDIDKETYDSLIFSENWSTEIETIKYLERDLKSLYEVMNTFKLRVFTEHYVHITRNLTISGLAMSIFLENYYNNNIPLINKKSIYNDIKKSYFGGITEVYKPFGENLYYYDVNSLYPFASLNIMPGLNCTYIDNINENLSDYVRSDNMFGFYFCKVSAKDNYLGFLPYRTDGSILMPNGTFDGWYFSEELKFAHVNGCDIQVIKGYEFERSYNVFDKYVKYFYDLKSKTTDSIERSIAKSLLNNLLGRFGMNLDKSVTELVNEKDFNELLQSKKIISVIHIGDKKLVTHSSKVSLNICETHEVDFIKAFNNDIKYNKKSGFTKDRLHDVSIVVASAVTSYARIYMNKVKINILKNKGSIYYSDTDSIVTDIKLDKEYVGKEIGKFKLEHNIKKGYFISNKNYCFTDFDDKTYITRSGVNNNSLSFEDFKKLYTGEDVKSVRTESVKSYSDGYVNIGVDKNIVLSANSYTKREKIYSDKLWVDTKPIRLNL